MREMVSMSSRYLAMSVRDKAVSNKICQYSNDAR